MNFIKNIIEWVRRVIVWFFVVSLALCFSIFLGSLPNNGWLGFLVFLLSTSLMVSGWYVYKGWDTKCSNCKKLYAMIEEKSTLVNSEQISIKVELKNKDTYGEVTGTREQYIPGTRKHYDCIYKCKFCGFEQTIREKVDRKNI